MDYQDYRDLELNDLSCYFLDGLCQLTIYDIMRNQGNWSCQVKLESNGSYVNATGSPLQLLVLASDWKDQMMFPINRFFS